MASTHLDIHTRIFDRNTLVVVIIILRTQNWRILTSSTLHYNTQVLMNLVTSILIIVVKWIYTFSLNFLQQQLWEAFCTHEFHVLPNFVPYIFFFFSFLNISFLCFVFYKLWCEKSNRFNFQQSPPSLIPADNDGGLTWKPTLHQSTIGRHLTL